MHTCMRVGVLEHVLSSICMYTGRLEYSGNYWELLMVISDVISCTMNMKNPLCCSVCCARFSSAFLAVPGAEQLCVLCPAGSGSSNVFCSPVDEESRCCWIPTHPAGSGRPPGRQLLGLHNSQPGWQHIREELGTFTGETHQKYIEINTFPPNVLIFTCGVFFHQKTHWKISRAVFCFVLYFFSSVRFSSTTKVKVIII